MPSGISREDEDYGIYYLYVNLIRLAVGSMVVRSLELLSWRLASFFLSCLDLGFAEFNRLRIPIRDYLGSVLPGLGDFPVGRIAELTPTAWASRN